MIQRNYTYTKESQGKKEPKELNDLFLDAKELDDSNNIDGPNPDKKNSIASRRKRSRLLNQNNTLLSGRMNDILSYSQSDETEEPFNDLDDSTSLNTLFLARAAAAKQAAKKKKKKGAYNASDIKKKQREIQQRANAQRIQRLAEEQKKKRGSGSYSLTRRKKNDKIAGSSKVMKGAMWALGSSIFFGGLFV